MLILRREKRQKMFLDKTMQYKGFENNFTKLTFQDLLICLNKDFVILIQKVFKNVMPRNRKVHLG
jgi:hypothetical protein